MFENLPSNNTFALTLGSVKQELKLVDGNVIGKETMEISLSCDASKSTYSEIGKLSQSLRKFSEFPHDMLTV